MLVILFCNEYEWNLLRVEGVIPHLYLKNEGEVHEEEILAHSLSIELKFFQFDDMEFPVFRKN